MALRVLVAHVLSPGGSELLSPGKAFDFALWSPADARAELMRIVDRHAIGYRAHPFGFRLVGVDEMNVERHDHLPDKLPPLAVFKLPRQHEAHAHAGFFVLQRIRVDTVNLRGKLRTTVERMQPKSVQRVH